MGTKAEYQAQKKKEAISMLKQLLKKIEREQFIVVSSGWWTEGTQDRHTFQIHVKEEIIES